jgi:hypothetical protein
MLYEKGLSTQFVGELSCWKSGCLAEGHLFLRFGASLKTGLDNYCSGKSPFHPGQVFLPTLSVSPGQAAPVAGVISAMEESRSVLESKRILFAPRSLG